jgi:hypothetical protein
MDYNLEDLFDTDEYADFGDSEALPPTDTADPWEKTPYIERSHHYWLQVPLPPDVVPTGGAPLAAVDDDTLLNMCPTLLVHMQRTAAMQGVQVISPRAASLGASFARTAHSRRTTDMFLVGSIASRNVEWPNVGEGDLRALFPNQPIDAYPTQLASRHRVKTSGIMSAQDKSGDPVLKSYLTGRAIVDLQRRTDVAGAGSLVAMALATAWGVDVWDYEAEAEATLAPMGELLRYAIRADEAYPMLNAPIEAKKCISVGANTAGRTLYGEYAAIDWRRLRVGMESVFYMCMRTEGYNLMEMVTDQPPGDPRGDPLRMGIMQFRPMPGSVWSYEPSTFRIDAPPAERLTKAVTLPARVALAIRTFYADARPIALAAATGVPMSLVPTSNASVSTRTRESLVAGYTVATKLAATHSARGKTTAAAVRDYLYVALSESHSLSALSTLWVIRYLSETANACGMSHLLDDQMTRIVAGRLSEVMTDTRIKIAAEASRRSEDLDDWWAALASSLPATFKTRPENTSAWCIAAAHYLIHPYSRKWANLRSALAIKSHRTMPALRATNIRLPAVLRSRERVVEAAAADARALGATYGAYYGAMREVCEMLAVQCTRYGNSLAAHRLMTAGMMWDIRAKTATSIKFHVEDTTSVKAGHYTSKTGTYHITTAPYPAYRRWYEHIHESRLVSRAAKEGYPSTIQGAVALAFSGHVTPLYHLGELSTARAFRYAARPDQLASDIERTLSEIMRDLQATIDHFENEAPLADNGWAVAQHHEVQESPIDLMKFKPRASSYWAVLLLLEQDLALAIEEALEQGPPDVRDALQAGEYADAAALVSAFNSAVAGHQSASAHDTIQ